MIKKISLVFFLATLIFPGATLADDHNDSLVEDFIICNETKQDVIYDADNRCDFNDLIMIGNLIINFLFQLSLAISVLVFLVVGAKYMFAGSSNGKTIAKQSFKNLAIGFALILGAYLIVNTLFLIAGVDTAFRFIV